MRPKGRRPIGRSSKEATAAKQKIKTPLPNFNETSHSPIRSENDDAWTSDHEGFSDSNPNTTNDRSHRNVTLEEVLDESRRRNDTPFKSSPQSPEVRPTSQKRIYFLIISVLVVLVAAACIFFGNRTNVNFSKANCSGFMDLKLKFPNQDQKLFKALRAGIEGTLNDDPSTPSVFALFSTNNQLLSTLMEEVIKITKKCINHTHDPIILYKEGLRNKHGQDFKDELMKRNLMIVNNVDEASLQDIPVLHSICDSFNPLWPKSIIILTMNVPRPPEEKPVEYIFDHLNDRWKSLDDNIRGPLITRIIDQTFFINPK